MLQNSLVIQLIIGISTLIIFGLGMYFWDLAENSQSDNEKYRLLYVILFIATVIGVGYFIYNLITTTPYSFGNGVLACIKALVLVVIGVEIFLYAIDAFDGLDAQGGFLAIASVITVVIVAGGILINNAVIVDKYDSNIIEVSEQKYEEEKFELINKFDEAAILASSQDSNYLITTSYFRSYWNRSNEMYEIFYTSNDEILYKEINAKYLTIIPIKDGEKPYFLIKTYTTYSLDYNNDPPTECNISESWNYELHVPEEDVKKVEDYKNNTTSN